LNCHQRRNIEHPLPKWATTASPIPSQREGELATNNIAAESAAAAPSISLPACRRGDNRPATTMPLSAPMPAEENTKPTSLAPPPN
jgi:hypothetical protein